MTQITRYMNLLWSLLLLLWLLMCHLSRNTYHIPSPTLGTFKHYLIQSSQQPCEMALLSPSSPCLIKRKLKLSTTDAFYGLLILGAHTENLVTAICTSVFGKSPNSSPWCKCIKGSHQPTWPPWAWPRTFGFCMTPHHGITVCESFSQQIPF